MVTTYPKETFVPEKVTYTIDVDGKLLVIEHVPARVCLETGEQLFSAETAGITQWADRAKKTTFLIAPRRASRFVVVMTGCPFPTLRIAKRVERADACYFPCVKQTFMDTV